MGLSKYFLPVLILSLVLLSSGCVTKTGGDITSVAKAIPEVKSFLNEYPNATVVVALWDNTTVYDNIASIRAECGNQFSVKDYYRVSISDPSLSFVVWLDRSSLVMTCAVRKQTVQAKGEEKGNIVEQEATNVTQPANQPNGTTSTIIDYCGNGKCDSGEDSNSCKKDCATTSVPLCGNAVCDSGEDAESCPNDCAYEIYPYESDSQFCQDSGNVPYTSTGPNYAHWFLYGGCGAKKYFHVMPGYKMIIYAYTDSCSECVCYHPNFYIYELVNGTWANMKYIDLPDEKGISKYITYVPVSYNVKLYATGCFYVAAYSEVPVGENQTDCRHLYWFDSSLKECGYKKFCGAYMYSGLQTFGNESDCKTMLQAMKNATNQTVIIPTPVTPSTVATTTTIQNYCNDTDGGINYLVKGNVSWYDNGHYYNATDQCLNSGMLQEYYCNSSGRIGFINNYNCTCSDGKCLNATNNTATTTTSSTTTTTICGNSTNCLPDLIVNDTYYEGGYYIYVKYCNIGLTSNSQTFLIKITNLNNSQHFDGNSYYPFSIPAPGTCAVTGGFTTGLVGLDYNQTARMKAEIDWQNTVSEYNENNNILEKTIPTATPTTTTSTTTTSTTTTIQNISCESFCRSFSNISNTSYIGSQCTNNYSYIQPYFCIDSNTRAANNVINNTFCSGYPADYKCVCQRLVETCPYTCSNGNCTIPSTTTTTSTTTSTTTTIQKFCNDTDGGTNYQIQGTCFDNSGTYTDQCEIVMGTVMAQDYYCAGGSTGNCAYTSRSCTAYGYTGCLNGACTNSTG